MKADEIMSHHWAEVLAALLLLVGFFIALITQSPALHYTMIFLAGLLTGRIFYEKHKYQPIFPYILIIIGFVLGFMLGAIVANKKLILVLFIISFILSHEAHKRGYITFFKSEGFIK